AGAKPESAKARLMIRQVPGTKVCCIAQLKLKPGGSKLPPLLHIRRAVVSRRDFHVGVLRPNETQAQPRLRGTQVAAPGSTLATLDIQTNDTARAGGCR